MTSNCMYACLECRVGNKTGGSCPNCGEPMMNFGKRITPPKKNNKRAWKRIASGEMTWNRRKVRGGYSQDEPTKKIYDYVKVPLEPYEMDCDHECCQTFAQRYRVERVPGSEQEIPSYRASPCVDLGG